MKIQVTREIERFSQLWTCADFKINNVYECKQDVDNTTRSHRNLGCASRRQPNNSYLNTTSASTEKCSTHQYEPRSELHFSTSDRDIYI